MNGNGTKDDGNGKAKRGWVKTEQGWEPTDQRTKDILFQIDAGRPFKDIAEQFGVTVSAISHVRARAERERRIKPRV
jgi:DNA-binding NarL/FixJ family response regulator